MRHVVIIDEQVGSFSGSEIRHCYAHHCIALHVLVFHYLKNKILDCHNVDCSRFRSEGVRCRSNSIIDVEGGILLDWQKEVVKILLWLCSPSALFVSAAAISVMLDFLWPKPLE